ncbi:MAG: PKD domain-containing protein [Thermoplasmatota archaeon]
MSVGPRRPFLLAALLLATLLATPVGTTQEENRPPQITDLSWSPLEPTTGDLIQFRSNHIDHDGAVVRCEWRALVGGEVVQAPNNCEPAARLEKAGRYEITLTVFDDDGASATASRALFVATQPPVADFRFEPASPTTDQTVRFIDQSTDADGLVVAWDWRPDGAPATTERDFQFRFEAPGTYTIRLTVTDDDGAVHTVEKVLEVRPGQQPGASFVVEPERPRPGDQARLVDTTVVPLGDSVARRVWTVGNEVKASSAARVDHVFHDEGPVVVSLEIETAGGRVYTAQQTLLVEEVRVVVDDDGVPWIEVVAPVLVLLLVIGALVGITRRPR